MEYLEQGDLGTHLKDIGHGMRIKASEITRQILEALSFLHDKGICHRDLKPQVATTLFFIFFFHLLKPRTNNSQNVLVACDSPIRVKLADFGVSKSNRGTAFQTKVGTKGFKAPELLGLLPPRFRPRNPAEYTHAIDMWSLGCLVHQLMTLEIPFLEKDELSDITGLDQPLQSRFPNYRLFEDFCYNRVDFPVLPLEEASIEYNCIEFIQQLLVPDPNSRPSAADALRHRWLMDHSLPVLCTPASEAQVIRSQFISLGVSLSDRTAENLAMLLGEERVIDVQYYLPPHTLGDLDTLRLRACEAGYTLLLRVLLCIRAKPKGSHSAPGTWAFDRNFTTNDTSSSTQESQFLSFLHAAVASGHVEIVQFLIGMGIDTNKFLPGIGRTALQLAASLRRANMITTLLDNGADINSVPSETGGRTALQAAAGAGDIDIVRVLLERGADCNA